MGGNRFSENIARNQKIFLESNSTQSNFRAGSSVQHRTDSLEPLT